MIDHAKDLEDMAEHEFCSNGFYSAQNGMILQSAAAEIRRLQDVEKRYEYLRKLNVPQFEDLYIRCLHEDLSFDDFVLKLANGEAVL